MIGIYEIHYICLDTNTRHILEVNAINIENALLQIHIQNITILFVIIGQN